MRINSLFIFFIAYKCLSIIIIGNVGQMDCMNRKSTIPKVNSPSFIARALGHN